MTTRTQTMNGGTTSMALGANPSRQASRAAEATRSLRLAERLHDEGRRDEYRAALGQHFSQFGGRSAACPLR